MTAMRLRRSLTAVSIAEKIQVNTSTISRYENGHFTFEQADLDMLESYGVDNWCGYGCNRDETKAYFYPGDWNELDEDTKFDTGFWDIAGMRIEAGEFPQLFEKELELFCS
jgi:transcriptional regulator with XRE-family HTH domain